MKITWRDEISKIDPEKLRDALAHVDVAEIVRQAIVKPPYWDRAIVREYLTRPVDLRPAIIIYWPIEYATYPTIESEIERITNDR